MLRENPRLRVFGIRVLKNIFRTVTEDEKGD